MRGRSSRNGNVKKIFYTALGLLVVVGIGALLPRLFGFVGSVVMTPIHGLNEWYEKSEQIVPTVLRDRSQLLDQIKSLEFELTSLSSQGATSRRLQDENQRLRGLLGVTDQARIAAAVIARPDELPYDLLQIDQGSRAGIQVGASVYASQDQLVGLVSHVTADYSLVTMFTSPRALLTGFIAGPDVTATIEGVGNGVARVRVPQGIPLAVGNQVYVPSVQPGLFGQIDYIENRPSQPEQFGYVTLPVSLQSLHFVAVSGLPIAPATPEAVRAGREAIISERLLAPEANTVSFEELLATSTPTTTEEVSNDSTP